MRAVTDRTVWLEQWCPECGAALAVDPSPHTLINQLVRDGVLRAAHAKFDLFQRLNSGTRLSEQEARGCLAVILDTSFSRWLEDLARASAFDETVDISDRPAQQAYDVETALRYLSIVNTPRAELVGMGDVGEFLTRRMRDFIDDSHFDRSGQRASFLFVIELLRAALGAGAFKRNDAVKDDFRGAFSVSAFEAIASGVAANIEYWQSVDPAEYEAKIRPRAIALWNDPVFQERSGGGKAAERRIPFMAEVGERLFAPDAHA